MSSLSLISRRLKALHTLPERREFIYIDSVRKEYRQDLVNFITGETLAVKDGKPLIGKKLYMSWLKKLNTKGFDYEIVYRK